MEVICTICSRQKCTDPGLMPAFKRYQAPHIRAAHDIAKRSSLPFFILSGRLGLIRADREIPLCDYKLEDDAVEDLARQVANQLDTHHISTLSYYHESKPSWFPYTRVLVKATRVGKVGLILFPLPTAMS